MLFLWLLKLDQEFSRISYISLLLKCTKSFIRCEPSDDFYPCSMEVRTLSFFCCYLTWEVISIFYDQSICLLISKH